MILRNGMLAALLGTIASLLGVLMARAAPEGLKFGRLSANGSGCKSADVSVTHRDSGIVFDFKNFKGQGSASFTRKNCSVALPIELGPSMKLLITHVDVSGTARGDRADGNLRVESFFSREQSHDLELKTESLQKTWKQGSDLKIESSCASSAHFRINASLLLHSAPADSGLHVEDISYAYQLVPCK